MKIKYKNYTIEPEGANFNLFKESDSKSKTTGEVSKVNTNIGWGMKFTTCIDRIIKDTLADNNETVSLAYFIDEYRKLKNKITETIGVL